MEVTQLVPKEQIRKQIVDVIQLIPHGWIPERKNEKIDKSKANSRLKIMKSAKRTAGRKD